MQTLLRPLLLAAALGVCAAMAQPAFAQRDDHHDHGDHGRDYRGRDFHGRDFHAFTPRELGQWRGGRWVHGWHDGRFAWWWSVDGGWTTE